MRTLAAFAVAACLMSGCNIAVVNPASADLAGGEQVVVNADDLFLLHNAERGKLGVRQLIADPGLTNRAQRHANWMAARGSLTHSNMIGTGYRHTGENIAHGEVAVDDVFADWMNSPGHRLNVIDPVFTSAGFGCAVSADGTLYWCAQFGG